MARYKCVRHLRQALMYALPLPMMLYSHGMCSTYCIASRRNLFGNLNFKIRIVFGTRPRRHLLTQRPNTCNAYDQL